MSHVTHVRVLSEIRMKDASLGHTSFEWDMNETCLNWMRHTNETVVSLVKDGWDICAACLIHMSHSYVSFEFICLIHMSSYASFICLICLIWMRHAAHLNGLCKTYQCVVSHISISHVTHINESYLTYEWVMSRKWISHITPVNESCHKGVTVRPLLRKLRVMTNIWMGHVTHIIDSWHTFMTHIWMSHVIHINESRHTYERVMSQVIHGSPTPLEVSSCATHTINLCHFQESCFASMSHITHQ